MKALVKPFAGLLLGLLFAGCTESDTSEDTAQRAKEVAPSAYRPVIAALETRIAQLELSQERLKTALTKAEGELAEMRTVAAKPTIVASNVTPVQADAPLESQLDRIIAAKIDEKLGTHAEIETIFTQAVQDGMEDYEKRKEEEAEQRAEERRLEIEKRREEREERQLSEIAQNLELTDFETEKLREARTGVRVAVEELFRVVREERGTYDRDQIRAAMEEIKSGHETVVAEFMSEEQVKAYSEMESNRMPFGFMGGGRRGRGR